MVDIKLERHKWLPCSCKVFTINGNPASTSDFGEFETGGSCYDGTCYSKFIHGFPTTEVLQKYGITLEEFKEIALELEDRLQVVGCGLCW